MTRHDVTGNGRSTEQRLPAALLVLALLVGAAGAMIALHLLQPSLDPVDEPVSFYAHGRHGWLLPVALGSFGTAAVALARLFARTGALEARARGFLIGFGLAMWVAAIVPSDRWFPWEGAPSAAGLIHAAAAVIGPVLLADPIVALARRPRSGALARWIALGYGSGLVGSGLSLVVGFAGDRSPPLVGLAERVLALAAVGWFLLAGLVARSGGALSRTRRE